MNKHDLIDALASEVGVAKSAAAETIDAFLATVTNAVVKGDPVQLIGFGSFSTSAHAARAGRNPKTGVALRVDDRQVYGRQSLQGRSEPVGR
jgi:DNA-binding protein HU-beta